MRPVVLLRERPTADVALCPPGLAEAAARAPAARRACACTAEEEPAAVLGRPAWTECLTRVEAAPRIVEDEEAAPAGRGRPTVEPATDMDRSAAEAFVLASSGGAAEEEDEEEEEVVAAPGTGAAAMHFLAMPDWTVATCDANRREQSDSWADASVGERLTIIRVLPSPRKHGCRRCVSLELRKGICGVAQAVTQAAVTEKGMDQGG